MSHVFPRHMKTSPPTAVAGEGYYIIDSDGKRYLDGSGGAARRLVRGAWLWRSRPVRGDDRRGHGGECGRC